MEIPLRLAKFEGDPILRFSLPVKNLLQMGLALAAPELPKGNAP